VPFFLGVEGIARHEGPFELRGGVFVEKVLGDGHFAIALFAAVSALGEGLAGGVETECHDAAESAFGSEIFAVEGEGFGEKVAVFHQPGVECVGEFDGVDAVDHVVDRAVAGHGEKAGLRVALGQADGAALVLIEWGAFLPDGLDVASSADEAVDDEGEHGAEGVANGFGIASVGETLQGVAQGAQLGTVQGTAGAGGIAISDGGLVGEWQETGAGKQGEGVFFQGPDPEVLGFSRVLIEVAAVSLEAFGEAKRGPVGGFVEGAGMFLGIVETFSQKRLETVPGLEFAAEGSQGKSEALAGEVGAAGLLDDIETPQLHDEFEAVGAGDGIPTDVIVAFLEALGGSAPTEDGNEFGAVRIGIGAIDSLPEDMSGGTSGQEVMALVEGLAEVVDLSIFCGGAQDEVVDNEGGFGHQCFHSRLKVPK